MSASFCVMRVKFFVLYYLICSGVCGVRDVCFTQMLSNLNDGLPAGPVRRCSTQLHGPPVVKPIGLVHLLSRGDIHMYIWSPAYCERLI